MTINSLLSQIDILKEQSRFNEFNILNAPTFEYEGDLNRFYFEIVSPYYVEGGIIPIRAMFMGGVPLLDIEERPEVVMKEYIKKADLPCDINEVANIAFDIVNTETGEERMGYKGDSMPITNELIKYTPSIFSTIYKIIKETSSKPQYVALVTADSDSRGKLYKRFITTTGFPLISSVHLYGMTIHVVQTY
jgi:hypothetical protein